MSLPNLLATCWARWWLSLDFAAGGALLGSNQKVNPNWHYPGHILRFILPTLFSTSIGNKLSKRSLPLSLCNGTSEFSGLLKSCFCELELGLCPLPGEEVSKIVVSEKGIFTWPTSWWSAMPGYPKLRLACNFRYPGARVLWLSVWVDYSLHRAFQ